MELKQKKDYAFICNNGKDDEVFAVTKCDNPSEAGVIAQAIKGPTAYAVECNNYSLYPPTGYRNKRFYNVDEETGEETEAEYIPSADSRLKTLQHDNEQLTIALAMLLGGESNE